MSHSNLKRTLTRLIALVSVSIVALLILIQCKSPKMLKISQAELSDKIYSSWLAQIIGNIYGLPHENAYIDEPGPEDFPYGYRGNPKDRMLEANGAFSDDDTDIEYMYLLAMDEKGSEPSYGDLTKRWLYHVRNRVWLANRAAVSAMHYGYTPPVTGSKDINPHWFQIDPQLVNEIWAVTSPGMVKYSAKKSAWAARITNDDWGIEPTIHYGAMYAAAFFVSDIPTLIDMGTAALPEGNRFGKTVEKMKTLHKKYPNNWQAARAEMSEEYYHNESPDTKTIWNANLNAAAGILALLYGEGDFQYTLDLSCAMGFDADNQAATMSGLLGVILGTKNLPDDLLRPFPELGWTEPFNDRYINVSRYDMPDASLKDMARRMTAHAEEIILSHGGKKVTENGEIFYLINPEAEFIAPLELPSAPLPQLVIGQQVDYSVVTSGGQPPFDWSITSGDLPEGLSFAAGKITGTPSKAGYYPLRIQLNQGETSIGRKFILVVNGPNLAPAANEILANVSETDVATRDAMWLTVGYSNYANDVAVIRDGKILGEGASFYSTSPDTGKTEDFYGYRWDSAQEIGVMDLHTGTVEENGGWFTSLVVEYQDEQGGWKTAEGLKIHPPFTAGGERYNKPSFVRHTLFFEPVKTTAIRIRGGAAGVPHWTGANSHFTSVTELSVHAPLP